MAEAKDFLEIVSSLVGGAVQGAQKRSDGTRSYLGTAAGAGMAGMNSLNAVEDRKLQRESDRLTLDSQKFQLGRQKKQASREDRDDRLRRTNEGTNLRKQRDDIFSSQVEQIQKTGKVPSLTEPGSMYAFKNGKKMLTEFGKQFQYYKQFEGTNVPEENLNFEESQISGVNLPSKEGLAAGFVGIGGKNAQPNPNKKDFGLLTGPINFVGSFTGLPKYENVPQQVSLAFDHKGEPIINEDMSPQTLMQIQNGIIENKERFGDRYDEVEHSVRGALEKSISKQAAQSHMAATALDSAINQGTISPMVGNQMAKSLNVARHYAPAKFDLMSGLVASGYRAKDTTELWNNIATTFTRSLENTVQRGPLGAAIQGQEIAERQRALASSSVKPVKSAVLKKNKRTLKSKAGQRFGG